MKCDLYALWRDSFDFHPVYSPRGCVGAGASVGVLRGRSLDGDDVLLGLQAGGPRLHRRLDGAVGDGALAGRGTAQIGHRMLHLRAETHPRLGRCPLFRDSWLDVQLHLRLGVYLATRQGGRFEGNRGRRCLHCSGWSWRSFDAR